MNSPAPLHLVFISWEFPEETNGGIGTYVANAVAALAARGHRVRIVAGVQNTGQAGERLLHDGHVVLHRLPCADRRNFARPAAEMAAKIHRTEAIDAMEAPELYAEGALLSDLVPGVPLLLRCHTPLFLASRIDALGETTLARGLAAIRQSLGHLARGRSPAPALRRKLSPAALDASYQHGCDPEYAVAARAAAIAVPSRDLARILAHTWPEIAGRLRLLPYPFIPSHPLDKEPRPPGNRTIFYHGRLRFYKGVDTLAAAIPHVLRRHPDVRFVFAGSSDTSLHSRFDARAFRTGQFTEYVDTLAWLRSRLAGYGRSVEFTGYLPPDAVRTRLVEADLAVLPSRWDNFPNACLEAMAAGRAIVATDSGGMQDMLSSPRAGLLVPPGSPRAVANAINRLLADMPLRHELARSARTTVLSRYSADIVGAAHERLFSELIESRGTPLATAPDRPV